jgi:hypothetical protein
MYLKGESRISPIIYSFDLYTKWYLNVRIKKICFVDPTPLLILAITLSNACNVPNGKYEAK